MAGLLRDTRRTRPAAACRRARGAAALAAARARTRRSSRAVRPAGRPAPRSSRAGKRFAEQLRAGACATRLAAQQPVARAARAPPSSNAAGSPERSALATASIASAGTSRAGAAPRPSARAPPASSHVVSAGRISVATPPRAAPRATASAASRPTSAAAFVSRIQPDTLRATLSMSEASGASNAWWYVAWSPTMFTIGVRARRALCRFAIPLPSPGPRCSSVAAGRTGHAAVAVGRAGGDAFEQREDRAHLGDVVERGDELHLRCTRVREAHVDAVRDQRADECVRAVHRILDQECQSSNVPGFRMPFGSNAALMRRISVDLGRILELEEVPLLLLADAVLGRDRAAELRSRPRGSRA